MRVRKVYEHLLKTYGPQGWWPVLGSKSSDPRFEIAVGAILTQSAAWRNVEMAIKNLYKAKALTPKAIVKMPTARLRKLIKPAGYFNQKCKKLKIFAKWLMENCGGDIKKLGKWKIDKLRKELLTVWGIGKETADSIILYALGKPIFVVDAYTRRLCAKFGIKFKEYDEYRDFFEKALPKSAKLYNEYHALIVASGKDKHTRV